MSVERTVGSNGKVVYLTTGEEMDEFLVRLDLLEMKMFVILRKLDWLEKYMKKVFGEV